MNIAKLKDEKVVRVRFVGRNSEIMSAHHSSHRVQQQFHGTWHWYDINDQLKNRIPACPKLFICAPQKFVHYDIYAMGNVLPNYVNCQKCVWDDVGYSDVAVRLFVLRPSSFDRFLVGSFETFAQMTILRIVWLLWPWPRIMPMLGVSRRIRLKTVRMKQDWTILSVPLIRNETDLLQAGVSALLIER